QDHAADDRVRHAAAELADGLRELGEEVEVHGRDALGDQVAEDQDERHEQRDGAGACDEEREEIDEPAVAHGHRAAGAAPVTRHTSTRARMLTIMVTIKSTSAISTSTWT